MVSLIPIFPQQGSVGSVLPLCNAVVEVPTSNPQVSQSTSQCRTKRTVTHKNKNFLSRYLAY